MKGFIKTLTGKTITFILCVLSICVLAASVVGIAFLLDDGRVYLYSEEEVKEEIIVDGYLQSQGYSILWNNLIGYPYTNRKASYQILDENGSVIAETGDFQTLDAKKYTFYYERLINQEYGYKDYIYRHADEVAMNKDGAYYTVNLAPNEVAAIGISFMEYAIHLLFIFRYWIYAIAAASLLLAIISFIGLMYSAGRKKGVEELVPGHLYKFPYDLLVVICGFCGFVLIELAVETHYENDVWGVVAGVVVGVLGINVLLGLCVTFAGRVKQHILWKHTLVYYIFKLIGIILRGIGKIIKKLHAFNISLLRGLPFIWKTGLIFVGISAVELMGVLIGAYNSSVEIIFALWLIGKLILFPIVMYGALILRKLQKGGEALANGELSYQTDTKGMFWDFKQHGNNLNSIAAGMSIAVEDRIKSERMKTELITNVSHDIKTPLTSIINYASLISNEPTDNDKITEYSEVLVRQSEKLKRLIEDLVEASKASTGNLDVSLAPCDASVFVSQASGEYEEKLKKAELTLVLKNPENEVQIMADGRRMWRIFDNLMNNICKYSMPGTRVYLSLEEYNGNAIFTFKNTSREPLNMTEEELMERFTRGDSSRNTEGNGLGLSIAKSMAELQGGRMNLSIDGDLFKAVLIFPVNK